MKVATGGVLRRMHVAVLKRGDRLADGSVKQIDYELCEYQPDSVGNAYWEAWMARGGDPWMNKAVFQPGLDTLATELLDNQQCREWLPQLNDFENGVFGPDFACTNGQLQHWVDSGCLFYSAVTGEAVAGHRRILSVLSVFITGGVARDRMLLGEIQDYELMPWCAANQKAGDQPTIYLSSVISAAPHHLGAMYESLLRDVNAYRDKHCLTFHGGFAIATGVAGLRHMSRSGFRLLDLAKYNGKYELMVIDSGTAISPFWSGLLHDQTVFLRRADITQAARASELPAAHLRPTTDADAHEVERRLTESKAERFRRTLDI